MAQANRVDQVRQQGKAAVLTAFWLEVRNLGRGSWGNPIGYLFVAPGVLLYALFSVYPILRDRKSVV